MRPAGFGSRILHWRQLITSSPNPWMSAGWKYWNMKSARTTEKSQPSAAGKRIFVPSDFAAVIQHVPEECPLVGGQAVAWWAQEYSPSDKPVTSCDIDFWGFRDDLTTLARAL